ncbi:MAG: 50S ribosomal protein L9 [Rhodobiaceae bacterium]|jgi:large subunit ribosomal protein L9|nr:50S ribosomal protein L9 [Rhodobiaceae bacterium]|tara:strand:+ start:7810 stop:8469 length:660 start_codon:yes stop_codon:yes gene_type:complete
MEVILLERIDRLGQMGDVVKVKDGYARNFLLPKRKALRASKENLDFFEKEKVNLEARNLKEKSEAEKIQKKLNEKNFVIIRQAGETGQLYGSVSTNNIKEALKDGNFEIAKNQVVLEKPIKELGIHSVGIKLHPEIEARIFAIVSRTKNEANSLIKGKEINLEDLPATSSSEEAIELEEVFEEGAIPEELSSEDSEEKEQTEESKNDDESLADESKDSK